MITLTSCPPTIKHQFVNEDAKLQTIHTVGDGTIKGTYFKALDVAKLVGITKATYVVANLDEDMYVKIMIQKSPTLYVNTFGLLLYLMSSKKGRATGYASWILDTAVAFTLNDHAEVVKRCKTSMAAIFQKDVFKVPYHSGVYVFKVGTVGELKSRCSKPVCASDDTVVYKFGMSQKSLARRLGEHDNDFENAILVLQAFVPLDLVLISERAIRQYVKNCSVASMFPLEKQQEMFTVSKNEDDRVISDINDIVSEINKSGRSTEIARLEKICDANDHEISIKNDEIKSRVDELSKLEKHHSELTNRFSSEIATLKHSLANSEKLFLEERKRSADVTHELLEEYRRKRHRTE